MIYSFDRQDPDRDRFLEALAAAGIDCDVESRDRVVVLDPAGTELLRIEGDALAATTQTLLAKTPSPVIPASAAAGVSVDLIVPPDTDLDRVTHRITYALEENSPSAAMIDVPEIEGPEIEIDHEAAMEIQAPVSGDGWLATSAKTGQNCSDKGNEGRPSKLKQLIADSIPWDKLPWTAIVH